jgi:quercetin dioxygenase-like cupin family protein
MRRGSLSGTDRLRRGAAAIGMLAAAAVLGACASSPAGRLPYPAFIQADELEPVFTATLPGTRAQPLFVDDRHGLSSLLLTLPADWDWNAGGAPGKSIEVYVLEGEIRLGDLALQPGNYAYLPPGSTTLPMSTDAGARLLYFLDDAAPQAVIRTPLFMSREVVPWQPLPGAADDSVQRKVLRFDPGSGATTALISFAPGARGPWRASSAPMEGFLLSGDFRVSVCVAGEALTGEYQPGGYFRRPAGTVIETGSEAGAVWLTRQPARGALTSYDGCPPGEVPPAE